MIMWSDTYNGANLWRLVTTWLYACITYHMSGQKCGNFSRLGTFSFSSISTTRTCIFIDNPWRKLPPKLIQSTGVKTAWIQPDGIKRVSPAWTRILWHSSTLSPKNTWSWAPLNVHFSKSSRFFLVGGMNQKIFSPRWTWYQTLVPPKSTWKSV